MAETFKTHSGKKVGKMVGVTFNFFYNIGVTFSQFVCKKNRDNT